MAPGNMKHILNSHLFYLLLYGILLSLALAPYYTDGSFVFGGEGNYFLDFSMYPSFYGHAWVSAYGTGIPNLAPGASGLNILVLSMVEELSGSIALTNFILIFSMYLGPFLAMYLVCKELNASPFVAFIVSLFYIVNPFVLYYLIAINQWNIFCVTVMPLFLWVILKFYQNNFKLFFLTGIVSACFSFTYANVPLLVIIQISIMLSVAIVSIYHNRKFVPAEMIKKYSIILSSYVLFNMWWILVLIDNIDYGMKIYVQSYAESYLNAVTKGKNVIGGMFDLTYHLPEYPGYDFFSYWYSTIPSNFITLIPIILIVLPLFCLKPFKRGSVLPVTILSILLTVLFFAKGLKAPLGNLYLYLYRYIPFFYVFKTPTQKFGILYTFILTVLLLITLLGLREKRYSRFFVAFLVVFVVFCSIPVVTGNILPDYKVPGWGTVSRKYQDKAEYKKVRKTFNSDKALYRLLTLPGGLNYQILLHSDAKYKYTGVDPILSNINRAFIGPHHNILSLYHNISSPRYEKLLGIYNLGSVIINEDKLPWFGIAEKEHIDQLKGVFNNFMPSKKWDKISFYFNIEDFVPVIYAPEQNMIIKLPEE